MNPLDHYPFSRVAVNSLSDHFTKTLAETGPHGAVGELLSFLAQGTLDGMAFTEIIKRHGVSRELWFRKQRLDLVLGYVSHLLDASRLIKDDLATLAELKNCLGIAEGEFISLRPAEVASILVVQLNQILVDDYIDPGEDLYQLELQTVFDLSYDQYLQLTRAEFEREMASLNERVEAAQNSLKDAIAQDLDRKIRALEPIYRLAVAQPRTLGALY